MIDGVCEAVLGEGLWVKGLGREVDMEGVVCLVAESVLMMWCCMARDG